MVDRYRQQESMERIGPHSDVERWLVGETQVGDARVLGYVRVSTEEQAGQSPADQRDQILDWSVIARPHGCRVEIYVDRITGTRDDLASRPALSAMLATARRGDVVVACDRRRLARNVYAAALIERECAALCVEILTLDGAPDDGSPESRLTRQILDVLAEHESLVKARRVKQAMDAKRRRNEYTGGHVPMGKRVGRDGRLERSPGDALMAKAALRYRARGLTLSQVAANLNDDGFRTRGGRRFYSMAVSRLLKYAERVNQTRD